jgi:hypothetical protein
MSKSSTGLLRKLQNVFRTASITSGEICSLSRYCRAKGPGLRGCVGTSSVDGDCCCIDVDGPFVLLDEGGGDVARVAPLVTPNVWARAAPPACVFGGNDKLGAIIGGGGIVCTVGWVVGMGFIAGMPITKWVSIVSADLHT